MKNNERFIVYNRSYSIVKAVKVLQEKWEKYIEEKNINVDVSIVDYYNLSIFVDYSISEGKKVIEVFGNEKYLQEILPKKWAYSNYI